MDYVGLVVDILSLLVAIIVFVVTSAQTKKATIEQTKEQNIRATLTDFSNLRRKHQDFGWQCEEHPEDRVKILQDYLADLERFAVGCNRGAYDLEVVSSMSGGMLIRQYRNHFRAFVNERRRAMRVDSTVPFTALYAEYVEMMRRLYEIRGERWEDIEPLSEEQWILERFLAAPITSPDVVLQPFRGLPGAVEAHGEGRQGYLYVPGTRKDRCVLAAHVDTVFDAVYQEQESDAVQEYANELAFEDGIYHGTNPECSIGADDRAGCAMLWALRKSGHSLLLLDGEEHGQIGSHFLKESNPELFREINDHTFIIQLDRRGASDYKCYELPVPQEFKDMVERETSYALATGPGRTDIQVLCEDVSGVNLSVGYYDDHKPTERVCLEEWLHTLEAVRAWIAKPLKRYPLAR